jgi:hypothetical protein
VRFNAWSSSVCNCPAPAITTLDTIALTRL